MKTLSNYLLYLVILSSCGAGQDEQTLIGTYCMTFENTSDTVVLRSDSTFSHVMYNGDKLILSETGTYHILPNSVYFEGISINVDLKKESVPFPIHTDMLTGRFRLLVDIDPDIYLDKCD